MSCDITAQYRNVASYLLDEPEIVRIDIDNKAFLLFGSNKLLRSVMWAGEPWLNENLVICDKGYLIASDDEREEWAIDVMVAGMPCTM